MESANIKKELTLKELLREKHQNNRRATSISLIDLNLTQINQEFPFENSFTYLTELEVNSGVFISLLSIISQIELNNTIFSRKLSALKQITIVDNFDSSSDYDFYQNIIERYQVIRNNFSEYLTINELNNLRTAEIFKSFEITLDIRKLKMDFSNTEKQAIIINFLKECKFLANYIFLNKQKFVNSQEEQSNPRESVLEFYLENKSTEQISEEEKLIDKQKNTIKKLRENKNENDQLINLLKSELDDVRGKANELKKDKEKLRREKEENEELRKENNNFKTQKEVFEKLFSKSEEEKQGLKQEINKLKKISVENKNNIEQINKERKQLVVINENYRKENQELNEWKKQQNDYLLSVGDTKKGKLLRDLTNSEQEKKSLREQLEKLSIESEKERNMIESDNERKIKEYALALNDLSKKNQQKSLLIDEKDEKIDNLEFQVDYFNQLAAIKANHLIDFLTDSDRLITQLNTLKEDGKESVKKAIEKHYSKLDTDFLEDKSKLKKQKDKERKLEANIEYRRVDSSSRKGDF